MPKPSPGGRARGGHGGRRKPSRRDDADKEQVEGQVFEVDEEVAEEHRNRIVNRYDKVDNYEYELPSDFEDEEVDEDEGWTAEDEAKFGDFFKKNKNSNKNKKKQPQPPKADEEVTKLDVDHEDEEEDDEDDDEDVDLETDEGEDDDADADEATYQQMIAAVKGAGSGKKRAEAKSRTLTESYPEGEFNLNPQAGTGGAQGQLSVEQLVGGLGQSPGLSSLKKKLGGIADKEAPLSAPLPKPIQERLERQAAYAQGSQEVGRWQAQIKANREAPSLDFVVKSQMPRASTAGWAATTKPETEMELEIAAMLEAGGVASGRAAQEAEELEMKHLSVEEAELRRTKLRKLRTLMFKHETRAKHLKKIKSRSYHKHNKKKKTRGNLDDMDPEDIRQEAMKQEWERAKERLTLKHRNTSRWAQRILKKGLQLHQEGTKAAIADQIRRGAELGRKMSTLEELGSGSEVDEEDGMSDSTEASDEEADAAGGEEAGAGAATSRTKLRALQKARARANAVLAGVQEEAAEEPKGLLALPFMARAMQKQRQQSENEAKQLLEELDKMEREELGGDESGDEDEDVATATTGGRHQFHAGARGPGEDDKDGCSSDEDEEGADEEDQAPANPKPQLKTRKSKSTPVSQAHGEAAAAVHLNSSGQVVQTEMGAGHVTRTSQPLTVQGASTPQTKSAKKLAKLAKGGGETVRADSEAAEWALAPVPTPYVEAHGTAMTPHRQALFQVRAQAQGGSALEVPSTQPNPSKSKVAVTEDDDDDEDRDEEDPDAMIGGIKASQRALISAAFAGDDVASEFAATKAEEVEGELPKVDVPVMLPGWGAWNGQQREPKFMKDARIKAAKDKEKAARERRDAGLKHVQISEKYDKKASKFNTPTLPFPFTSREAYDRSMRLPIGRDFNTDKSFRDMTRPKVLTKLGQVIEPLKYVEGSAKPKRGADNLGAQNGASKRTKR